MNKEILFEFPSAMMTLAESIAYKRFEANAGHPLNKNGFISLQKNFDEVSEFSADSQHIRNPYCKVNIYNETTLFNLAEAVIESTEIRENLYTAYGMKFSVDFIYSSQIASIPIQDSERPFYANEFHRDMLFSSNIVKLFIALEDIDQTQGPTEWISKQDSQKIVRMGVRRGEIKEYINDTFFFSVKKGGACLLNPHTNIHKAGIPEPGKFRSQIMVQLNPYADWAINKDLYKRQFLREPNLPLLRNFGLRKPHVKRA
jgi:hypothetical protein